MDDLNPIDNTNEVNEVEPAMTQPVVEVPAQPSKDEFLGGSAEKTGLKPPDIVPETKVVKNKK